MAETKTAVNAAKAQEIFSQKKNVAFCAKKLLTASKSARD